MLPILAIIGRPNVGKSALFNRLTRSRDALVADVPGLTRDRQYGKGEVGGFQYLVIDTGGIDEDSDNLNHVIQQQVQLAIQEADHLLFVVDARVGLTRVDEDIANQLRKQSKPITLVANKMDGLDERTVGMDCHELGLGHPALIAAAHGSGVSSLMHDLADLYSFEQEKEDENTDPDHLRLAVVGRPNVGKSTLINRLIGEERLIVYDSPGTTRDSIDVELQRGKKTYVLVDTAGVRRRARVTNKIEKFSVGKTLKAIERANVVLMVFDAQEGITEQDRHLLDFTIRAGKAIVLAVNKWDSLPEEQQKKVDKDIERKLNFVNYARLQKISALRGTGVTRLFSLVEEAYASACKVITTAQLNRILGEAIAKTPPPMIRGRRIKLRFANPAGKNPPKIAIHGNQTKSLPQSYHRYLVHAFREGLKLVGTPILLTFKTTENPFKHIRSRLTPRQERQQKQQKQKKLNYQRKK